MLCVYCQVIPLHVAESQSSVPINQVSPVKYCCPSASVLIPQHNTSSPLLRLVESIYVPWPLRCSLDHPLRPFTSCVLSGRTLGGAEFFPGCRVLARREVDGLYYLGTGRAGVWVVDFDHSPGAVLGLVSSQRQLVCSLDMVNHVRDHTRCLLPGDAVLSPWEPDLRRYGPGRVMAATERRDGFGAWFYPFSPPHYDRIVRELQIPTPAPSQHCSWLCAHSSSCAPQLFCTTCSASTPCCCSVTNHWPCTLPPSCRSSLGGIDGFTGAEREKQVDKNNTDMRKSDPEVPSSSSSSLSDDDTSGMFSSAVKLRSKQQRPPWRYWKRTGPEPQHRQPGGKHTFHHGCTEQSCDSVK
uniref:DUF4537 domain-containing protein n=1 Tax=Lates calcarifer TaxID=8187 RepID=A0A4W6C3Z9_LATCA